MPAGVRVMVQWWLEPYPIWPHPDEREEDGDCRVRLEERRTR